MPAGLGYTFAPGADAQQSGQRGQTGTAQRGLSPASAVKLLQLRVPERPAASAIAPQALLQAGGGAALGGGGLEGIIRALAGVKGGAAAPEPPPQDPPAPYQPPPAPSQQAPSTPQMIDEGAVWMNPFGAPSAPAPPPAPPPYQPPPMPTAAPSAPAIPPPRITPGVDESVVGKGTFEPVPEPPAPEPLPLPDQGLIDMAMNLPVSGGQPLGEGGGILGGRNWRNWLFDEPGNESLF